MRVMIAVRYVPIIDSGMGKMGLNVRLNVSAITRVSSRCWLWSSPTGTRVDLWLVADPLTPQEPVQKTKKLTCTEGYLLLAILGRPINRASGPLLISIRPKMRFLLLTATDHQLRRFKLWYKADLPSGHSL
jgi:hypothetical protein